MNSGFYWMTEFARRIPKEMGDKWLHFTAILFKDGVKRRKIS